MIILTTVSDDAYHKIITSDSGEVAQNRRWHSEKGLEKAYQMLREETGYDSFWFGSNCHDIATFGTAHENYHVLVLDIPEGEYKVHNYYDYVALLNEYDEPYGLEHEDELRKYIREQDIHDEELQYVFPVIKKEWNIDDRTNDTTEI